jgi:hypothetical protein
MLNVVGFLHEKGRLKDFTGIAFIQQAKKIIRKSVDDFLS